MHKPAFRGNNPEEAKNYLFKQGLSKMTLRCNALKRRLRQCVSRWVLERPCGDDKSGGSEKCLRELEAKSKKRLYLNIEY
jgi:hypothetical protein